MNAKLTVISIAIVTSLTLPVRGSAVRAQKPSGVPLRGAHELCTLTFDRDKLRPARVEDQDLACLQDVAKQLRMHPGAKALLIGSADPQLEAVGANGHSRMVEDETGEDLRFVDIAAYRAINTKSYLTKWMGISPERLMPRTTADAARTVRVFLIPGDTFVDMQFPWTTHIFEEPCTIKPCYKPLEERMHAQPRSKIGTPDEQPPHD